jgi:hypothetical protein
MDCPRNLRHPNFLYSVLTGTWPPESQSGFRVILRTDERFKKDETQAPFTHLRGALLVSTDTNPDKRLLPVDFSNGLRNAAPGCNDPFVPQIDSTSSSLDQLDSIRTVIEVSDQGSSVGAREQRIIGFRRSALAFHEVVSQPFEDRIQAS